MSRNHRIVIIGIGWVAEPIAKAVQELPNATLVAASCRTRAKGEDFARRHGCEWYQSTEQMLQHERADVAIICTPSGAHLEAAELCAQHRVHVLCEKPLEITTERMARMIETCDRAGVVLGGIFPQRYNPVIQPVAEAAREGRLGELALTAVSLPWWRDDAYYGGGRWQGTAALDGGGALMNQASHSVDLLQWLAGLTMPGLPAGANPVDSVFAWTAKRGHDPARIEVEDVAVAALRFRNGALGQVLASTAMYPGSLRRLLIGGRNGTIEVVEDQLVSYRFREERPEDAALRAKFRAPSAQDGGAAAPGADYHHHQRNIADYLCALDDGRRPALDGREAGKAVEIIQACYESARTGSMVKVGTGEG